MKRVIVLGGNGFFGKLVVQRLAAAGLQPVIASRSSGDVRVDANDPASLRANLKQRDLVVDAAGPFQNRNSSLIDAARTIGFDVIDLSDSADYAAMIYRNEAPIGAAGIRVLTACSSLSTVSALVLASIDVPNPKRLSVYLRPASRYTANPGSMRSFLAGAQGRARTIRFPRLGARSGVLVKSVDGATLPAVFPSLQTIELIADSGNFAGNMLMPYASVRRWTEKHLDRVMDIIHKIGNTEGILGYEIAGATGRKHVVFTGANTHMVAVIPAIEAARAIAEGRFAHRGLIPPTAHLDPNVFWQAVRREAIDVVR